MENPKMENPKMENPGTDESTPLTTPLSASPEILPESALEGSPDSVFDSALKAAERVLAGRSLARLHPWGLQSYGDVLALQERLREARQRDAIPDTWLAGEHLAVITQGVRGQQADLVGAGLAGAAPVGSAALPVFKIDRGGMTTLHNPGQLVIYPIVRTQGGILAQARFSLTLLGAVRDWLAALYGIQLEIQKGRPGLFHGPRKVAAIGLSIHGRVSMHGIAINLCNDLSPWRAIVPCGEPSTLPITLSEIAGRNIAPATLIPLLPAWLCQYWGYETVQLAEDREALFFGSSNGLTAKNS